MRKAFTLVELLIVVAILALLAAIAVPNFLEAQVRSKVTRAKTDMRALEVGIETYSIDHNRPPIGWEEGTRAVSPPWTVNDNDPNLCWNRLTTPVAYVGSVPADPFVKKYFYSSFYNNATGGFHTDLMSVGYRWYIRDPGPTAVEPINGKGDIQYPPYYMPSKTDYFYDPSNGTISVGWIVRSNRGYYPENK